jgi:hypothetical protein
VYMTSAFVKHLYKSEDLLFKVIFDRKYRHDMQRNLIRTSRSISQQEGGDEKLNENMRALKSNYLYNIEPTTFTND